MKCTMGPPTLVAIFNQRSADGALQQYICVCCRCVVCLNLSNLLMVSTINSSREGGVEDQEITAKQKLRALSRLLTWSPTVILA
jgi:hypothetical protein